MSLIITTCKIIHRNQYRIKVAFPYDAQATALLRQIPDAQWSRTLKSWHIPYTKEAFAQLKELFPEISPPTPQKLEIYAGEASAEKVKKVLTLKKVETAIPIKPETAAKEGVSIAKPSTEVIKSSISVTIYPKIIELKMPKNEADIQFVRSLKYAKWNSNQFCWTVPNYGRNADLLKSYFGNKNAEIIHVETQHAASLPVEPKPQPEFTKTEFLVINNSSRTLRLFFSFNPEISLQIKKIPMCQWNGDLRCWEIPYSERFLDEVKQIAALFVLNFNYHEEKKPKIQPRKSKYDITNFRSCPQNYLDKLTELRYSKNTVDVYSDMFEEFINHYEEIAIDEITEPMIMDFLLYLVNTRHVSTSYQNQSINAINPVGLFKN